MELEELAIMLDSRKPIAKVVKTFAYHIPQIEVEYKIKPIA